MHRTPKFSRAAVWFRNISVGSIICFLIAVFMTTQWYFTPSSTNNSELWPIVFEHYLIASYTWGILTIFIQRTVAHFGFDRERWIRTFTIYLSIGIAFSFLHFVLVVSFAQIGDLAKSGTLKSIDFSLHRLIGVIQSNLIIFLMVASFCLAISYFQKFQDRELRASKLESQLTFAHLSALKSQLQPHFLFNTFNTIAALIPANPPAAEQMVVWLSDLLRATLNNANQELVRLGEELIFSQRYLEIEKVRFGDRLNVVTKVDSSVSNASVPILLLQPLVENAIRHGVAVSSKPCTVTIAGHRDGSVLCLEVSNSVTSHPKTQLADDISGVGLKNTVERLKHIYSENFIFQADNLTGGGFYVRIEIPFQNKPKPSERVG